jgi:hypothetical protein
MGFGHGDLAASIVLIFPALMAYEIGVLFAGHVNGADVVTRALYGAVGRTPYLMVHAAVAGLFLIWVRGGQRWAALRMEVVGPVVLEAAVYALTLGAVLIVVVDRLLGMGLGISSVVDALGAGVHEELVFRLGLFGGLVWILARTLPRRTAIACALVASSVLFAAAHHAGALGEPFTWHAFAYRCIAGGVFALIAWHRSLAHAVYAHALYDLLVYWRA